MVPPSESPRPPAQTFTHGSGLTPSELRDRGFITLAGVVLFIAAAANALAIDGLISYGLCVYGFDE